jgi:formate hydrogenlyase subunit 3/multisubunit Na+/H+ antiporter MnhD subunit
LPASSWRDLILAFLILGFGLKIGLVPLHLWMPLAYTAAPAPGSAVMSGIAINAGVIGLIRFLPFTAAQPGLGTALIAAGIISTFYGVVIGINRLNPKTVLAYSSVSQMGVIATLLGVGLATASNGVTLAAGFYAAHHLLVKGGLFLATGIVVRSGIRRWPVLIPATIVGLALAGLPLTGGFVAKAAVKPFIGEGSFAAFAALSSAGTTVLMLHFINCLTRLQPQTKSEPTPIGLIGPWLVTAFAAITIPWTLLPPAIADGALGILSLQELWSALWPILLGAIAAIAWWYRPLKVHLTSRISLAASLDFARFAMEVCATLVERTEAILRRWQAAGISLLAVATLFILILASGR